MLNRIDQLEKREKLYLLVGIIVILATIIFYGIYQPYHQQLIRLDKKIASKQSQLKEVRNLQAEYQSLQKQVDNTQKKMSTGGSLSPLAKVEELASNVVSREKLSYIRPQPPQIQEDIRVDNLDIKLEKLSLEQMLQLLWEIEAPESQMQIKNFRSKKRFDNSSEIDLTMTISVYGKN
ncbi:type II secretion system protein GspM [uncultured Desulfuromusa sp.]|uniref:type II secretion system protein GspM n=1 Tax=uncultured Desulfuromusa sp. TaxID=219183 RepID=UPI002AA75064|nr:type II secretion system protein GspM [uncultured Desulfuromusa sp.]